MYKHVYIFINFVYCLTIDQQCENNSLNVLFEACVMASHFFIVEIIKPD